MLIRFRTEYDPRGLQQAKADTQNIQGYIARAGQASALLAGRFRNAFAVLAAGATGASVAFAGVEKSAVSLGRVTGLSGSNLTGLTAKLTDLGLSLGLTEKASLDLATTATRLGIKGQDLGLFMKTAQQASVALGVDVETTSDQLARLRSTLQLSVPDLNKLTGAIISLDNVSAATFPEILASMRRVGPLAKIMGLSGQELAAFSAALIESGVSAEVAGTTLSNTLAALLKKSDELGPVLGLTGQQLRNLATSNPAQAIALVAQRFNQLVQTGQSTQDFFKALGLVGRNSVQVLSVLGNRTDRINELLRISNNEFQNGTLLQKFFGEQAEILAFQLEQLKAKLFGAARAIGERLAPIVKDLITVFGNLADAIRRSPFLSSVVAFGLVGGAIAAAAGFLVFFAASQVIAFRIAATGLPTVTKLYKELAGAIGLVDVAEASAGRGGGGAFFGLFRKKAVAEVAATTAAVKRSGGLFDPVALFDASLAVGSARYGTAKAPNLFKRFFSNTKSLGFKGALSMEALGGSSFFTTLLSLGSKIGPIFEAIGGIAGRLAWPLAIVIGAFTALNDNIFGARDALVGLVKPFQDVFGSKGQNGLKGLIDGLRIVSFVLGAAVAVIIRVAAGVLKPIITVMAFGLKIILTALEKLDKYVFGPLGKLLGIAPKTEGTLPTIASRTSKTTTATVLPNFATTAPAVKTVTTPAIVSIGSQSRLLSVQPGSQSSDQRPVIVNVNNPVIDSTKRLDALEATVKRSIRSAFSGAGN